LDGGIGIDDVVSDYSSFILVLPRESPRSKFYGKTELISRDQIQLHYLDVLILPDCFALLFSASEVDIWGWRLIYTRIVDNMYHLVQQRFRHGIRECSVYRSQR
jgi:hypothetical protein